MYQIKGDGTVIPFIYVTKNKKNFSTFSVPMLTHTMHQNNCRCIYISKCIKYHSLFLLKL